MSYPRVIENLIERLMKLPGVGRRSAERMVLWMLNQPKETCDEMAFSIAELKTKLRFCKICNNFTETDICRICADQTRDRSIVCIVENPKDAIAIEKTGAFKGLYHVLLGAISPAEGVGIEDLNIFSLMKKIAEQEVLEVVIATDADMEGELTALHLIKVLKPFNIKVSRIGIGLPAGGAVEFADISTLSMSFNSRREVAEIKKVLPETLPVS